MNVFLRHEGWSGRAVGLLLGALAVSGQAPLHIWPVTLICMAGLYLRLHYAAQSARPRKAGFHSAMWFALGYFGVSIFWVGSAFIARGPAFIPIMPPMVLGLAGLLAIFWGLAGGFYTAWLARVQNTTIQHKGLWAVLAFTSFFFLAEFARGHVFGGLPWNLLGYIFEAGSAPSQIAAWINIYGLTWCVILIAACLGQAWQIKFVKPVQSLSAYLIPASLSILILIGLYGYGTIRLSGAENDYVDDVKIRIVSVPFDQADHLDPQKSYEIVNGFLGQSLAEGVEDVTHIVWPEGAVLGLAMENEDLLRVMGRGLIQYDKTPPVWLMQSLRLEQRPHPKTGAVINDFYNSSVAVTFDAAGNPAISNYNDKHRLVPFGEFIPGGTWLESQLPTISASLSSLTPAKTKTLSTFPGLPRLSAQICYEAVFPGLTPKDLKNPAKLILNQSNDAWYGKSWGPWQHANIARYRALEQGLPMIRVASNGVSAVISPYGGVDKVLTARDESHIDTKLPKALNLNNNTKFIIFILCLLNVIISLLCTRLYLWGKQSYLNR